MGLDTTYAPLMIKMVEAISVFYGAESEYPEIDKNLP
jgi:hypothetical protein